MSASMRTERAWAVYELAAASLADAEQRQRFRTSPYAHPARNRALQEAVDRARRALDRAAEDLAQATRFEA